MRLYQTIDGTLIGFYHEKGGVVQAQMYRDIYEQQLVTKERQVEIDIPGYYEEYDIITPGFWKEEQVYVQGHYEIQNIWVPEYYVTRYYWREAHPARGLEAAWIPYQHLIPAGYKDQRVWVEGEFVPERTWVEETTRTERVWVPPEKDFEMVEYQELEEVWVGREPVYEYVDPMMVQAFEVLELIPAPEDQPDVEDIITIRNTETGEVLRTTATYLGLAEQIDDNEYVVP